MSSTVCQGLQSCLEPRLVQQRALCLRLVSPKPQLPKLAEPTGSDPSTKPQTPPNEAQQRDSSTFSSIKSMAETPQEGNYIHPLSRCSRSRLGQKSLDLCTEDLGCETGTGIIGANCFSSSCSSEESEAESQIERRRVRSEQLASAQKRNRCGGAFPPPLTSTAGGSCIHVRPHREDGRLVIKTITTSSSRSHFQVQRREGRLLIHFPNKITVPSNTEETREEECEEEVIRKEKEESSKVYMGAGSVNVEGVNGNENNGEVEMGIGKIQRPGRCCEWDNGKKKVMVWEPIWVASS